LVLEDVPNDIHANPKIVVNENISQAGNFPPIDFRMCLAKRFGNSFYRFTNDFEVTKHGIDRLEDKR